MRAITREQFLQTDAGVLAQSELRQMVNSNSYNTLSAYDASTDRKLAFIDRHINYLVKHPHISPTVYLSNLKIMTKAKW